jgi:hypothetical protein
MCETRQHKDGCKSDKMIFHHNRSVVWEPELEMLLKYVVVILNLATDGWNKDQICT